MADNVDITAGTGTTIGADEISSVKYQRIKLIHGPDGTNEGDVANANGLPVKFQRPTTAQLTALAINVAGSGDNTLVSATASQTTRVFKLWLQNTGSSSVNVKFKDGAGSDFHPAITLRPGGSFTLDFDGEPWFVTTANTALILNLSAAVQVSGRLHYEKSA